MFTVKTYVATSAIHGAGVFLGEPVKAGQTIWEFNPVIDIEITRSQLAALPPGARETAIHHTFADHDGRWILSRDNAVFLNHSDTPNTLSDRRGIHALHDLPTGTEVTEDFRAFPRGPCNEFLFEAG